MSKDLQLSKPLSENSEYLLKYKELYCGLQEKIWTNLANKPIFAEFDHFNEHFEKVGLNRIRYFGLVESWTAS